MNVVSGYLLLAVFISICTVHPANAQLPPLFANTPIEAHSTKTLVEFPRMTFLENLVVADEAIYFTSHEDGKIYVYKNGSEASAFVTIPGKITGIARAESGEFQVTAFDVAGKAVVHAIDAQGKLLSTTAISGAIFLNGIESLGGSLYLIADSYKGVIWRYDSKSRSAKVWLESELLARADSKNPIPAANGIRNSGSDMVISNTAKMLLLRVPVKRDGSAGKPQVWKQNLNVDDFAVEKNGSIVAATHIYNNVIRIDPKGTVTIVATASQNMAGSTSVALSKDGARAYVTTNGGMFLPPADGVQPGRLLEIQLKR